ncbi:sonic hedgehog protein [Galendromus occidentalis]|uniref:Hedgehog protein n=1 Tax=Galendromus occidentalis TaxID=34638 RepID=A0AAJ6QW21_9ACAR|nr:sonic hedgehog protein [Galendromus occidentalis]
MQLIDLLVLALAFSTHTADACGVGRVGFRRRPPRKLTPLVIKQYVPNVGEHTDGASGPPRGPIVRYSKGFSRLVPNYNKDIQFADDEGTGVDRIMSQRLRDKLNILAVSVMNQWPGVKLRVVDTWVERKAFKNNSLHYEGRAVDITTDDRQRSKYGMLARLAVEAGFDWVFYEDKKHIHASVKLDPNNGRNTAGCFERSSVVQTRSGSKPISQLNIGEEVLTYDEAENRFEFSPVLTFLDRDPSRKEDFFKLKIETGEQLLLTRYHLIYRHEYDDSASKTYASRVLPGDVIFTRVNGSVVQSKVVSVHVQRSYGVYAPMTASGNIVVNNVVASCYALVNDHSLAHTAFAPLRLFYSSVSWVQRILASIRTNILYSSASPSPAQDAESRIYTKSFLGVHWYARTLYTLFRPRLQAYFP